MSGPYAVNGRFLGAPRTGVQRAARSLLDHARRRGLCCAVAAPRGVDDPLVDRSLGRAGGRASGLAWEQVVLPAWAGRRPVLSLANTGPVLAPHAAVLVHDLAPLVGPQWFAPSMRVYGQVTLRAARRADRVLTVSAAVGAELAGRGVAAERLRVVRPCVDPVFRPAPVAEVEAVRARLRLEGAFVLFVGWADPRKDLATALAAHRRARSVVEHTLVVAGRPHPNFAPVELPAEPSVRTAGYLADGDLVALMTGCSALVYPTRYEGFGLPPLEAMACGAPALVSDLPVLHESAPHAAAFLPVGDPDPWADAIVAAVRGRLPRPGPPARRDWGDAAGELIAALGD